MRVSKLESFFEKVPHLRYPYRPWICGQEEALKTMARPLDPVSALLKLVDACDQSARVFRNATEYSKSDAFRRLSNETWETFSRFGFELQTEVRRIEDADCQPHGSHPLSADEPDLIELRCEIALRT